MSPDYIALCILIALATGGSWTWTDLIDSRGSGSGRPVFSCRLSLGSIGGPLYGELEPLP